MSMLPHWQSVLRVSTVLSLFVVSILACGAEATNDHADVAPAPVEIGQLEQSLNIIYESTYMRDGYGKEYYNGSPDRCNWGEGWPDYLYGCSVPKYKTIKIRIMPHDYDGCWGDYWTAAFADAIWLWNFLLGGYSTGFQFQTVTSGEHVRIWCDADASPGGLTNTTSRECTQNWPPSNPHGLCKEKKWNVRVGGDILCLNGCVDTPGCVTTIAMHELGHVLGLAHHDGPGLMGGEWGGSYPEVPTLEEMDFLWAFCPGNGSVHCDGSSRPW